MKRRRCGRADHPSRRFRLDLHRHLWDARRSDELRTRSGADRRTADWRPATGPDVRGALPRGHRCAVDRWAAEAEILLDGDGRPAGPVTVRVGSHHRLRLDLVAGRDVPGPPTVRIATTPTGGGGASAPPVLPDAATWVLPDLELIRTGSIEADRLHPLVASALLPDRSPTGPSQVPGRAAQPRLVECRGVQHRIGLVNGVLAALDHEPAEVRREELLAALTGAPLPCLRAIDEAHRHPECLADVRERLEHGDVTGALTVIEGLLGPDALLRSGALRDRLETAALRRIDHGLFRADLAGPGPARVPADGRRPRDHRSHPRHTAFR